MSVNIDRYTRTGKVLLIWKCMLTVENSHEIKVVLIWYVCNFTFPAFVRRFLTISFTFPVFFVYPSSCYIWWITGRRIISATY